jgi:hypothetical protein
MPKQGAASDTIAFAKHLEHPRERARVGWRLRLGRGLRARVRVREEPKGIVVFVFLLLLIFLFLLTNLLKLPRRNE